MHTTEWSLLILCMVAFAELLCIVTLLTKNTHLAERNEAQRQMIEAQLEPERKGGTVRVTTVDSRYHDIHCHRMSCGKNGSLELLDAEGRVAAQFADRQWRSAVVIEEKRPDITIGKPPYMTALIGALEVPKAMEVFYGKILQVNKENNASDRPTENA